MALIIFSFLPETPKSSLCVTFCYMAILNFQYNQLDMLYFSILLHHRRMCVEIVECAHGVMMSISLNINRFERLSGRLFLLLSHEKKVRRRKMSPLYEASSDMSSMTIFPCSTPTRTREWVVNPAFSSQSPFKLSAACTL